MLEKLTAIAAISHSQRFAGEKGACKWRQKTCRVLFLGRLLPFHDILCSLQSEPEIAVII